MYTSLIPSNKYSIFNILDDEFDNKWFSTSSSGSFFPKANVEEQEKNFLISLELPSLKEKDVDISIKENILTISGEKKRKTEKLEENYASYEVQYGKFSRSWTLPREIKSDEISAKFENGVLNINIPKEEAAIQKKTVRKIAIN